MMFLCVCGNTTLVHDSKFREIVYRLTETSENALSYRYRGISETGDYRWVIL